MINLNYILVKSSNDDVEKLIEYKKETVFKYANNLSEEEKNKINNYINNNIASEIKNYCNIVVDDNIVGCLLLIDKEDGKLLDEIYLKKEYRNKGIGTDIIKNIIKENNIIYLWVYKSNTRAISLYKKLGFSIIQEEKTRYYMKYEK